jgi:hypothetical protein
MIKTHQSLGLAAALVCGALLLSALFAFAQDQKPESKTEDDGNGGKITTTYSTHDGKNFVEKVHKNAKGKLLRKETETSGPDGTVEEIENYDFMGTEQPTSKWRYEKDRNGKVTGGRSDTYKDGILVEGEMWVLKPGDEHYTVIKKWNNLQGKFVDVPLEEQKKQAEKWKKMDEDIKKHRAETEKFFQLLRSGKISFESSGTGETIGHVADLKIQNLTDEPLDMIIPPLIVESSNAENQDDVCPHEKSVMIVSRQIETVPLDGVCINRDKPPVAKGLTGALVLNMAEPDIAQHSNCHIPAKAARDLLRICSSIYDAVDKLENDGAFKDFPYRDKQEQKDIAIQWIVWSDPRICEITGGKPATKEDFDKVVYKQVEQRGPVTPPTRKKIDKGDDAMWNGIQLASAKAKDLENREDAGPPPSVVNVADNTPAPAPKTETVPQGSPPPEKPAGQDKTRPNDDLPKESYDALDKTRRNYLLALFQFESKLSVDLKALRDDLYNPEIQSSPDYKKKLATYNKLLVDVPKEFTKTKEGKKLLDQWLETYEKAYKTGKKVPQFLVPDTADPYLKPVAKGDEIANKKQALSSAQLDLEKENTKYSQMQKDAVANSDAVKKFEAQIEKEYGKGIQEDTGKLKQLQADMENAGKQVAKDWASTDEAKDQMKKVQQAEKDLDKAKEAYKPYEQLKEKPAKQTKP